MTTAYYVLKDTLLGANPVPLYQASTLIAPTSTQVYALIANMAIMSIMANAYSKILIAPNSIVTDTVLAATWALTFVEFPVSSAVRYAKHTTRQQITVQTANQASFYTVAPAQLKLQSILSVYSITLRNV